jgi:glycerophosphoryl diester phosphodiesterase
MILIGHRGGRFEAPENTLPGFRYALDLGLEAVEFDLRLTRDGQVVVIHDSTVDRTTNGTGAVADLTLAEIQALDARAIFPDWAEPCRVPTFAEVLDVVGVLPGLLVEIKHDEPGRLARLVPLAVAEIKRRGIEDRVTLTSFDPHALELARSAAPEIRRGYIGNWDSQEFLDTAIELECGQIDARHATADRDLVRQARARGMRVVGWPTNSEEDLASVLALEPEMYCSDRPTLLRELTAMPSGSASRAR